MNKKLLILYDYFDPAYKAGGPIRSLVNLVRLIGQEREIYILTSNQDHDGTRLDVESDRWISYGKGSKVKYLSKGQRSYRYICKSIREVGPDIVYLNGLYSLSFLIYPLLYLRGLANTKVVIAPRGMLQIGALEIKSFKKRVFLTLFRIFLFSKEFCWHATDEQERFDIETKFTGAQSYLAGNVPEFKEEVEVNDIPELTFVSISLLARKKNHLAFLRALRQVPASDQIVYHIYGPVSDQDYYNDLLDEISALPEHIKVEFKGSIHPSAVHETLKGYRFYVLTSFGENFGHSIFEAFNQGTPVIIGDQTPWKGLRAKEAGWDVNLSEPNALLTAIQEALEMDDQTYRSFRAGARRMAENYMQSHDLKKLYLKLFG